MDERTKAKLEAIYKSPVKRWILEAVIDGLLFWQIVREICADRTPGSK